MHIILIIDHRYRALLMFSRVGIGNWLRYFKKKDKKQNMPSTERPLAMPYAKRQSELSDETDKRLLQVEWKGPPRLMHTRYADQCSGAAWTGCGRLLSGRRRRCDQLSTWGRQQLYVVSCAGRERQWYRYQLLKPVADGDRNQQVLNRDGRRPAARRVDRRRRRPAGARTAASSSRCCDGSRLREQVLLCSDDGSSWTTTRLTGQRREDSFTPDERKIGNHDKPAKTTLIDLSYK